MASRGKTLVMGQDFSFGNNNLPWVMMWCVLCSVPSWDHGPPEEWSANRFIAIITGLKNMSRGQFLLSNNCMFIKVWIEFVWQLSRWNKPTTLSLDVTCIEVEGCLGSPVSMIIPGKMLFLFSWNLLFEWVKLLILGMMQVWHSLTGSPCFAAVVQNESDNWLDIGCFLLWCSSELDFLPATSSVALGRTSSRPWSWNPIV